MLALLAALALTAPPLAPGVHRCGTQWAGYSELCTVTVSGEAVSITSEGPSATFAGKIVAAEANRFTLDGDLRMLGVPLGYTDFTTCHEPGPFVFRHTGKRRFFRHTQTCKDMTTTYFDVFIDVVDPATQQTHKKLSAMTGMVAFDPRKQACVPVTSALVGELGDSDCQRWNESGRNSSYFECTLPGAHIYVFAKPASCNELRPTGYQ